MPPCSRSLGVKEGHTEESLRGKCLDLTQSGGNGLIRRRSESHTYRHKRPWQKDDGKKAHHPTDMFAVAAAFLEQRPCLTELLCIDGVVSLPVCVSHIDYINDTVTQ